MEASSAGVVLTNGKKVLLVHQTSSNLWSIPKGSKNQGETNDQCWRRELQEETGISELPIPHTVVEQFQFGKYNVTVVSLDGIASDDELPEVKSQDTEIDRLMWADVKDVQKYSMNAVTSYSLRTCKVFANKTEGKSDLYRNFRSCKTRRVSAMVRSI